jgi:hypothetical protein
LNEFCGSGKAFYDKGNGLIVARLGKQRTATRKSTDSLTAKQYQRHATGKKVKHQIRLIARRTGLNKQNGVVHHSLCVVGIYNEADSASKSAYTAYLDQHEEREDTRTLICSGETKSTYWKGILLHLDYDPCLCGQCLAQAWTAFAIYNQRLE